MERYRTTIILVVVLVVLAGAALLLQSPSSGGPGAGTTPTPTTNVWGAGTSDPISAIDVVSGTKRVSLRQEVTGTTWLLLEPIKAEADNFAVGNVVDQLKTLQAISTYTDTKDISVYGLDKPPLQITLKSGGSKSVKSTLLVGKTTPDGANYYLKLQDKNAVYVVPNSVIEPMKSWLDTPPKAQPTATPVPLTVLPPNTPTPLGTPATITGTKTLATPGAIGPPITGTTTLTGTSPITSSVPGAANPTTPLPPTPVASPTVK